MSGRYAGSPHLTHVLPGGRRVTYLAPRIIPQGGHGGGRTTVRAEELDRLDLVAERTLHNPLLAWRIADANDAMDPFALVRRAGAVLLLPGGGAR